MRERQLRDEGFTLIEVVVALLVFAVLSTGVVAGATQLLKMTNDNRARTVAVNLAAAELDTVRSISDVYGIQSVGWRDIPVGDTADPNGYRRYQLKRDVQWISASGAALSCNNSSDLSFLQVNVRVKWDGMLPTTPLVRDDTILSPTGGVSTGSTGAIAISVYGADGLGVNGISASVTPSAGGSAPAQPRPTTAQGCTFANDVAPGAYTVKLQRSGYRDDVQSSSPAKTVTVKAGTTQSVSFTYDHAITLSTDYTAGGAAWTSSAATPVDLPTTFLNTGSSYTLTAPASSVSLFPFSSGYSAVAGPMTSGVLNCASVDPSAWLAGTVNGVALAAGQRAAKGAQPGGTATLPIPMGVVLVRASNGARLTVTQALPEGAGNPGCSIIGSPLTYSVRGTGGWVALRVPFGSWSVLADGLPLGASNLQVTTNVALPGVSALGIVTLDPRSAQ